MMTSHNQNAERNLDIETTDRSFEIAAKFIVVYLGTRVKNQYLIMRKLRED
jgi:hypothetical protein